MKRTYLHPSTEVAALRLDVDLFQSTVQLQRGTGSGGNTPEARERLDEPTDNSGNGLW